MRAKYGLKRTQRFPALVDCDAVHGDESMRWGTALF